ncbi:MAG: CoA transferase, partial [Pseudomonadales bacterium]|nr:CoA transferase [Pseudomonadales bacterium]
MSRPGLLTGVRVVDLSMGWAGPLAARHLADMGADVIKVEGCVRFDWWRGWEATREWIDNHGAEKNPAFNMVNRNKRDLTLDLSTPVGSDLLKRLVAIADVVVENYSAGVLPKLGLDYPVLAEINPALVMISMPGSGYRAYGSTVEQASGLPHLSGDADSPPTMVHVALGDSVGGLNGAAALLTALYAKQRTGEGQHLDLSQSECLFPLGVQGILIQSVTGEPPPRLGNRSSRHAPHGVYRCVGEDEWIAIAVQSEDEWEAFSAFSGIDGFGDVADRLSRVDELDAAVTAFTEGQVAEVLMLELQAVGVRAGHV